MMRCGLVFALAAREKGRRNGQRTERDMVNIYGMWVVVNERGEMGENILGEWN